MPPRPLPAYAHMALEVISSFKGAYIPTNQYELAMSQRGYFAPDCRNALASLARQNWIKTDGLRILLTDTGWAVAMTGVETGPAAKKTGKGWNRRMPSGLF